MTNDEFEEFKRLLDTPLPATTKLEKLFNRPSVWPVSDREDKND